MQGWESILKEHWRKLKLSQNNIRCHHQLMAGVQQHLTDTAEDLMKESRKLMVKKRTLNERS